MDGCLTELQKPACIECGRELFDGDGFLWGPDTMRAAVDGFLQMTPGGKNEFNMTVGDKFNYIARKWRAQRTDKARSYGFKWMLNQPSSDLFHEAFEAWLLPLLREHRGKLVFLVRQHLLRLMVSKEANQIDSARFENARRPCSFERRRAKNTRRPSNCPSVTSCCATWASNSRRLKR